jgi:hypothetical protein
LKPGHTQAHANKPGNTQARGNKPGQTGDDFLTKCVSVIVQTLLQSISFHQNLTNGDFFLLNLQIPEKCWTRGQWCG